MNVVPYQVRNVLRTYNDQVSASRRLARYKRISRSSENDAERAQAVATRRRDLVHRIAAEIVENLIISESEQPIVQDIRKTLEKEFGKKLVFTYPPEDKDVRVYKVAESERPDGMTGVVEVTPEEKAEILHMLWRITLIKVDETMI